MRTADLAHLTLAMLAALSLAACAPGEPESDELDDLDESAAERDDAIIGGSPATAYPESVLIEMKINGSVASLCSGAMIAPNVVLTAGHCVHGYTGWNVTAPFASNQKASSTSAETYDWDNDASFVDPNQHDVGLIYLNKSITLSSYPTVAESPIAIGSKVQNIGRIDNGKTSYSKLFIGPQVKTKSGSAYGYPLDYVTNETIQSGDSGGPVIVPGTHKIVAVNSGAGGGTQVLARVDLVASWIKNRVAEKGAAATPAPSDPCNGITYAGQCNGNTVVWCENNQLQQLACGSKSCGWDGGSSFFNCL